MKKINLLQKNKNNGYVMLFSILITAIILSIIIGIANVSFRQRQFTQQVTQSTRAFYAAETALECLIALDSRGDFGDISNLPPGPPPPIPADTDCDGDSFFTSQSNIDNTTMPPSWIYKYEAYGTSSYALPVSSDPSVPVCARAKVTKYDIFDVAPGPPDGIQDTSPSPANTPLWLHSIEVWGYNVSCADLNQYYIDINGGSVSPIANKLVERSLSYRYVTEE
jgi:hypothetical protein